ncbi:hypothetical protein ACJX0J_011487, partial [Zea mays]
MCYHFAQYRWLIDDLYVKKLIHATRAHTCLAKQTNSHRVTCCEELEIEQNNKQHVLWITINKNIILLLIYLPSRERVVDMRMRENWNLSRKCNLIHNFESLNTNMNLRNIIIELISRKKNPNSTPQRRR